MHALSLSILLVVPPLVAACGTPAETGDAAKDDSAPAAGATLDVPDAQRAQTTRTSSAPANGWGDDIVWRSFEEGRQEAKELGRPLMLIVWTTWCGNCKALKKRFAKNEEIRTLSDQFIMVNVDQDQETTISRFGPDGKYIPRVLFFDTDGEIDGLLFNDKRTKTRYFYSPVDDLAAKMREALKRHA